MASRPLLTSVLAAVCVIGPLAAQQPKTRNPIEERLKAARLETPEGVDGGKFSQMRNGNVLLEKPDANQLAILDGRAKQLIYPVTQFEYYTAIEAQNAELTPRTDDKTVSKLMTELRGQLLVIPVGDGAVAATKVQFSREFGAACVRAIDEVLNKGPQPVVRMNAVRMLAVVAETGAPAAAKRVTELLKDRESLAVEALYYVLKAAEQSIAMYDPARSANNMGWVTRDDFFALVSLVDDVVQKIPASVALNTYQPDQTGTGVLTTDPKSPPKAPTTLTAEQEATMQAFRLQAVRALARVKTDVVLDPKGEGKRRTALTLARVAVNDASLVPVASLRERIEAVGGLANAVPTDQELDPQVLAVAMGKGVKAFAAAHPNPATPDTGTQIQLWKLTGARMKSAFTAWDKTVGKAKLDKEGKQVLSDFAQAAIASVFEPMSKQSDGGVVNGLSVANLDTWLTDHEAAAKAMQLYKDSDKTKLSPR